MVFASSTASAICGLASTAKRSGGRGLELDLPGELLAAGFFGGLLTGILRLADPASPAGRILDRPAAGWW